MELFIAGHFFLGFIYTSSVIHEDAETIYSLDFPTKVFTVCSLMTFWPLALLSDFLQHHYPDDYI